MELEHTRQQGIGLDGRRGQRSVVLDWMLHESSDLRAPDSPDLGVHTLPVAAWSTDELPNPSVNLDDIDREDANLLRLVTARDPIGFGDLNAHAVAFLSLARSEVLDAIASLPIVQGAYATTAGSDAVLALGAKDEHELLRMLTRDLRRWPDVTGIQVAHIVTVLRHRTHLVRLVPPLIDPTAVNQ